MNWAEYYDAERKKFIEKVSTHIERDLSYSREDDLPLTEEDIQKIDAYWSKYRFAYPNVHYGAFKTFKNRCGFLDVRSLPGAIRAFYLRDHFVNKDYSSAFQNKALLPLLFPDVRQPRTIACRMNGYLYDGDYNLISEEEAVDILVKYLAEEPGRRVIVKPNGSSGGHNISTLDGSSTRQEIARTIRDIGKAAFVMQEMVRQSAFTAQFNPSSLNTIRLITFLYEGKYYPLAGYIRFGTPGAVVDNWHSGGAMFGINVETGCCNTWAMARSRAKITEINGVQFGPEPLPIPNFDKVKELCKKLHCRCPYVKLISWDIGLDEHDEPIMIECNFGGEIQGHESLSGSLFGDLTDELLDRYLLKEFFFKAADDDFIYDEYADHAVICKYIGEATEIRVPDSFRDKPVTAIKANAFRGCRAERISAPLNLLQSEAVKTLLADESKKLQR